MSTPEVNVWWDGRWFGPSYPDAGTPEGWKPLSEQAEARDDQVDTRAIDAFRATEAAERRPADEPSSSDGPPPLTGAGASKAKWASYAEAHGVKVDPGMSRDGIVDAVRSAGVRVE